jgi:hypothetical protein
MQNSEKKIDGLFRDKLQSHEVIPPPAVWDTIVGSLDGRSRKRRMIMIWGLSSAASLLFAFLAGWYFSGETTTSDSDMQATNSIPASQSPAQTAPVQESPNTLLASSKELNAPTTLLADNAPLAKTTKLAFPTQHGLSEKEGSPRENFVIRFLSPIRVFVYGDQKNNDDLIAMDYDGLTETDRAIIASNMETMDLSERKAEVSKSGFGVGVQASPVYRFDGNNQPMRYNDNLLGSTEISQEYVANITGGVVVTYRSNKRFSVQTGLNYGEVSQSGGDIGVTYSGHNWVNNRGEIITTDYKGNNPLTGESASNNVILNTELGFANIDMPVGAQLATANSLNKISGDVTRNYNLEQQAGYLEIPLIVRYRIIDQRLGFHLLGGVNTNVLMSNNASLVDNNNVVANGKTEGLNPLTFSSSLGVGMNYAISERFNFSLEPTMKIQINSLNSQSYIDARPYTVGVFTGVTYNF